MLYQITNASLSVGGELILSHIDFEAKGKEKIALVGKNGAGKTCLLRLIAGQLEPDRDDKRQGPAIRTSGKLTIGFLEQTRQFPEDMTVDDLMIANCPTEELYSKERYLYEVEYDRLFTGLGFSKADKSRRIREFSGGQQTKIAMIHLLLGKPDLLLLDEPTNHLDVAAVEWLEDYLKGYERAVLMVSHDRFFLDRVAEIVYELEDGRLTKYSGNYTDYRLQKYKNLELQKKAWERQQEEIRRLEDLVRRFKNKPNKAAFARSRKSILQRMEVIEKPGDDEAHIFTGPIEPQTKGAKWILEAEHLKIGYEQALLELSLRVRRGQKIGIIGENGAGKTTFLRTIAGLLEPLEGSFSLGNQTMIGYFDQQTAGFTSEKTVLAYFHDVYPAMSEKDARITLANYLFTGRDTAKKVAELSGGEKARLKLCEILSQGPNLLILDEPTNHMDIPARETLESAFRAYTGTILFVSHDRYFVDRVADAILVFEGDEVSYYPFGYLHYLTHSRAGGREEISARISAENQALIADLKAVPKGESHRIQEIDPERAYVEWRLGQKEGPIKEAEDAYRLLWELGQEQEQKACVEALRIFATQSSMTDGTWLANLEDKGACFGEAGQSEKKAMQTEEMLPAEAAGQESAAEKIREAENVWTLACLEWYDLYLELAL